ncbi:FUSC family protein [Brucella pituitosa]|uniref:FUSC family protein n=1 Tax=Brucella pituitosa TaxID=571256 RepID=UPI0009A23E94|nr:FUSC family protein [Brucella pituitosa]
MQPILLWNRLTQEMCWAQLKIASAAILPFVVIYLLTNDIQWISTAGLVCICTIIVWDKLALSWVGVLLHGLAIAVGFIALALARILELPHLFIALCIGMACISIRIARQGEVLRSLGNFTFIPTLYLASEMVLAGEVNVQIADLRASLFKIIIGAIPTVGLAIYKQPTTCCLSFKNDFGQQRPTVEPCLAATVAVGIAAYVAGRFSIDHGQWLIWSAASIVTTEAGIEHWKLGNRTLGALIGVPIGIGVGLVLPHTSPVFGLDVAATLLTLLAFKRYLLGFTARCALIAVGITVTGQSAAIGSERIANVIIGGLIGFSSVFLVRTARRYIYNLRVI